MLNPTSSTPTILPDLEQLQTKTAYVSGLLKALSHPDRLLLLCELSKGEFCVSELEQRLGIGQPSLSQQLGILRKENIVATRRAGKQIFYSIASEDIMAILTSLNERFCTQKSLSS